MSHPSRPVPDACSAVFLTVADSSTVRARPDPLLASALARRPPRSSPLAQLSLSSRWQAVLTARRGARGSEWWPPVRAGHRPERPARRRQCSRARPVCRRTARPRPIRWRRARLGTRRVGKFPVYLGFDGLGSASEGLIVGADRYSLTPTGRVDRYDEGETTRMSRSAAARQSDSEPAAGRSKLGSATISQLADWEPNLLQPKLTFTPGDARKTGLADNSVDLIGTTVTPTKSALSRHRMPTSPRSWSAWLSGGECCGLTARSS